MAEPQGTKDLESNAGIYSITNLNNGKRYIGSTTRSFRIRWQNHRGDLLHQKHRNSKLQRAWNKHGEGAFAWEILIVCPPHMVIQWEQVCINAYQATDDAKGYNINPTAGNSRGRVVSQEQRAKMRGRVVSQETRDKMSRAAQNRTPEHRAAIAAANRARPAWLREQIAATHRGRKLSEETRAKMSARKRGVPKSPEHRANLATANRSRAAAMTPAQHAENGRKAQAARTPEMRSQALAAMHAAISRLTPERKREIAHRASAAARERITSMSPNELAEYRRRQLAGIKRVAIPDELRGRLLSMADEGMSAQTLATWLRTEGVQCSRSTVATRLKQLRDGRTDLARLP